MTDSRIYHFDPGHKWRA